MALRTTIRIQILLLLGVLAFPLVVIYAELAYREFDRGKARARQVAAVLAELTANDAYRMVENSKEFAELLATRSLVRAFDPDACDPLLSGGMHEMFPRFLNFATVDRSGRIVCSSRPQPGGKLTSVADREWFQEALRSGTFQAGKPAVGALTARHVTVLAHPVRDAAARTLGLVILPIDLLAYRPVSTTTDLRADATLGLLHQDGTIVWRSKDAANWIGKKATDREVMRKLLAVGQGSAEGEGVDGTQRIYAINPVRGTPWYAYAGISRDAAHADLKREVWRALLFGLAALGAASAIAWLFARRLAAPVSALGKVARAVKSGDAAARVAPAGPLEIAEAGEQFNAMLEARQTTEARLQESEARLRALVQMSSDWLWEQDAELRFIPTDTNPQLRAVALMREEDTIGKHRWDMPITSMSKADWDAHRAVLARREPFRDLVYQGVNVYGELRWSSINGEPVFAQDGTFCGYRGTGTDITERKRAEAALRESEERYRALVELTSDWYWRQDEQYRFTYREGLILAQMGLPVEQDYGKTRWEMGFLNMSQADWALHRAVLDRREEFRDLLLERKSPDGRIHWAVISGRPLFDAKGDFAGYHGTGRDVTAQISAQEALKKSEAQLRLVVDNVPAMIAYFDIDETCRFGNEAYAAFHGLKPAQAIGRSAVSLMSEPGRKAMLAAFEDLRRGQTARYTVHTWDFRREPVYLGVALVPHQGTDGEYLGYFVLMNNLSELFLAQKGLRESEQRFRAIFEACPVPMSLTRESDGTRRDVNPAWEAVLGFSRDEVVGNNLARLDTYVDPADRTRLLDELKSKGQVDGFEFRARRKDGTVLLAQSWVRRLVLDGEAHLLLITRDVTGEREAERRIRELNETLEMRVAERTDELIAANRELEAFAYSVSHDLRTPLRGIDGYGKLLQEGHADRLDEEGREFVRRIRRGTQRMGQLIDDLLDLASVTRGVIERRLIDVSALAAEIAADLAAAAPSRKVTWRIEPGILVNADPGLLRIALENVLGNAWKYSQGNPDARIEISAAEARAEGFEFLVRDNGAGFDMTYADRLFRPFQRLHASSEFEGTGIGLATVQRILQRHGGKIKAAGRVGLGATFLISTKPMEATP